MGQEQEPPHSEFDELMERLGMARVPRPTDAELEAAQLKFETTRRPGGRRHNDPPTGGIPVVDQGLRRVLILAFALVLIGSVLCLLLR